MLIANDITKSYKNLQVLNGLSFEVQKGEIVAIVGSSGAGKSTLLHIIGTLDSPNSGKLKLDDTDVLKLKGNALAKFRNEKIGFVFQFHNLLPEFTALENVCLPAFLANIPTQQAEKKAKELLDYLGLKDRMTHLPSQMSGGEQQRTAIARALVNNPQLVLADEPSGNLDFENATELHNLFFNLRKEMGYTFIIVTHNQTLANMSDRMLVMRAGLIEGEAKSGGIELKK